jgi:hypothetical protein
MPSPCGCETQYRCMERVYCGLSPEIAGGTLCMILESYADDSETDDRYIVAGYIASLGDWKDVFVPDWYSALKNPPRLGHYRTSDALALKGQFERFNEVSRDERLRALARAIPNKGCLGVMSSVSKKDFEEFCIPSYDPTWDSPYYLCAIWLITCICQDMHEKLGLEKIDFFFDRQGKMGQQFKLVYDAFFKPTFMSLFSFIGDVRHEDKCEFLPLQAADMQAGWMRRSASTIQRWTSADIYLSQIEQRHYPIRRSNLEASAKHKREHADEIAAYWARSNRRL